jgi:hypothetical protein
MIKGVIVGVVLGAIVLFGLMQLIPYGHDHTNPPIQAEPQWNSAETRALAVRACFDCHSNQTEWPWYTNVAPFSWLVQRDVNEGRRTLNFSEWNRPQRETRNAGREIQRGSMPQWYYVLVHPTANLSPHEKQALIDGLNSSIAQQR